MQKKQSAFTKNSAVLLLITLTIHITGCSEKGNTQLKNQNNKPESIRLVDAKLLEKPAPDIFSQTRPFFFQEEETGYFNTDRQGRITLEGRNTKTLVVLEKGSGLARAEVELEIQKGSQATTILQSYKNGEVSFQSTKETSNNTKEETWNTALTHQLEENAEGALLRIQIRGEATIGKIKIGTNNEPNKKGGQKLPAKVEGTAIPQKSPLDPPSQETGIEIRPSNPTTQKGVIAQTEHEGEIVFPQEGYAEVDTEIWVTLKVKDNEPTYGFTLNIQTEYSGWHALKTENKKHTMLVHENGGFTQVAGKESSNKTRWAFKRDKPITNRVSIILQVARNTRVTIDNIQSIPQPDNIPQT